jgi:hypothetical protein
MQKLYTLELGILKTKYNNKKKGEINVMQNYKPERNFQKVSMCMKLHIMYTIYFG